jgi:hypothetical protein
MGAWTEIVDFTFTANETSRAFTGLNITKDDFIKVVATVVNNGGTNSLLGLFPNTAAGVTNFDTTTNYHAQFLGGFGTSATAGRNNLNSIAFTVASQTNKTQVYLKMSENGKYNTFYNRIGRTDSSIENAFEYTTSSNLTFNDPITSLTFTASVTNGLGSGSRIQIYRLDAEKVADITTTANATQVDISSLSIGKDSEYLLVSDISNSSGSTQSRLLFVNDNTTETDYYAQRIRGADTTASATRNNRPEFNTSGTGNRTISYSHIKLSEIGAYTSQNYSIREYGTTTPAIGNWFVSSTAENITSITKLNIKSTLTNGIGSDSRFILYKLK